MYRNIVDWLKTWYYDKNLIDQQMDDKQDTLVSGETIKTINDTSLLGAGNIVIEGGSGGGGIYSFGLDFTDIDDPILYIDASSGVSYHLEFLEASYTAIGGVATVSVLVLENYEPVEDIDVTFSSDESTTTTATTDANGVATATITFGDSTTLTASYESATATATITVQTHLYAPTLDGTEAITTIRTYTPTISNNELVSGCGYLTNGWDNTIDWELTFEYYVTGDNNGYLVIPKGTSQRDYNGIQQWYSNQLNFRVNGSSPSGNITYATSTNQWINVKVTKVGYVWKVYYDDILKTTWNASSYASVVDGWTEMCIGLDRDSNRNSAKIRNIIVDAL